MISNQAPLVSVIMANYNGGQHIEAALQSVLMQSIDSLEVLVADDASTDNSVALVEAICARDARVCLLTSKVNGGAGAARNRALDRARGVWIAIVDADDLVHPDRLARMIAASVKFGADAVADDMIYFSQTEVSAPRILHGMTGITPINALGMARSDSGDAPLGYLKPLMRRTAVGDLRYREDIRIGEDHDFYMRYLLGGGRFYLLPEAYYLYRRHSGSVSHRLSPTALEEMIGAQRDLPHAFPDMGPALATCLADRETGLRDKMAFEILVERIKAGRFVRAALAIARNRALLPMLMTAAQEHRARRHPPTRAPGREGDILLLAPGQAAPSELPMVERVPIPKRPDTWNAGEWAAFVAKHANCRRAFGIGVPGLHALGYILGKRYLLAEKGTWPEAVPSMVQSGHATALRASDLDETPVEDGHIHLIDFDAEMVPVDRNMICRQVAQ